MTIAVLVVGVWAYSIAAVKQDSFADVDEEARILAASGFTQNIKHIDEERAEAAAITPPKGILAPLLERHYPRLLDPTSKTFIWGAPPVDRIGRLRRD